MLTRSESFRSLAMVLAVAFTVSGCVTTVAVAPARVAELAALPENAEVDIQTDSGVERVNGSTRVTLHSALAGGPVVTETRLSSLRVEGGALVLSEYGQSLPLSSVLGAEITKPAPGRTAGLVVGVVLGTALLVTASAILALAVAITTVRN